MKQKQGYLMFAVGNDCVEQACLCAMSIKATQTINNVSIHYSILKLNIYILGSYYINFMFYIIVFMF